MTGADLQLARFRRGALVALAIAASAPAAGVRVLDAAVWNPTNTTAVLQEALTGAWSRVIIRAAPGPWCTEPLVVGGNREIVLEAGAVVEALRGGFHGLGDSLITVRAVTNVTIRGSGVLRMWPEDYTGPHYRPSEWRHAVNLRGAVDVQIEGLRIERSGGDGIYVGAGPSREPCRRVVVRDVVCERNHRQGISVITVDDLLLERVELRGTCGTAPKAGLDVEPNHPWEQVTGCRIVDCVAAENLGGGFVFYLAQLGATSTPVSIRLERCRADRNGRPALVWTGAREQGPTRGELVVVDCKFRSDSFSPVEFRNVDAGAVRIELERVHIESAVVGRPPLTLVAEHGFAGCLGGVSAREVTLRVPDVRTMPVAVIYEPPLRPLGELGGAVMVEEPDGRRRGEPLSVERLRAWQPELGLADLPRVNVSPSEVPPRGEPRAGRWPLRHSAVVLVWPDRGGDAELELEVGRVGECEQVEVRVFDRRDAVVILTNVARGTVTRWRLGPAELAPWRVQIRGETAAFVVANPRGHIRFWAEGRVHLFGWTGEFEIQVPAGPARWAVLVRGSGTEGVRAELADPEGQVIASEDNVVKPTVLWGRPVQAGRARLRLLRPSSVRLEDYSIELYGCMPWIDPVPLEVRASNGPRSPLSPGRVQLLDLGGAEPSNDWIGRRLSFEDEAEGISARPAADSPREVRPLPLEGA
ncbi:MAG: hypothetical protein N2652_10860 [Kiritimatiellae bacterium]|nr:hypothetical protein [Kiritimatiellia bacterium]